ncbi:ATPase [Klebsiella pneumoniae]|uniref:ATPase n=1 Tax=Klebsiella pneumoniae TaxID=573 RepID=A0A377V8Z4_KLEPN|nr:ATPase [Klebsiella pneumoniae]
MIPFYQELQTQPRRSRQAAVCARNSANCWVSASRLPGRHLSAACICWGGVGRGKTWLMDLFYQSLPGERKQRLHFHRFMLRVHEELTTLQGHSDPLEIVADRFKAETDVLCFDEFFVSDITDAMLLGGLMKACSPAASPWWRPPIFRRMNSIAMACSGPVFYRRSTPSSSIAIL